MSHNDPGSQINKDKKVAETLTQSAGRGALWQLLGGSWQAVVRLGASTVLARALAPEDFGLVGMALIVRELVETIGALGMGAGVIAKKEANEDDLCTCFWTMGGVRLLLFVIIFSIAP